MALVSNEEDLNVNQARYVSPTPQEPISVLGAAFRQENDIVNLIDYMSRPAFTPSPAFDFDARAKGSELFLHNPMAFAGVKSDAEWDYEELKLQKEIRDRAALGQAGWGGVLASMAAGVLSPTILIPVGGQYKAGGSALAAGARAAGWTMFGATLQEGVLQMNQDERTLMQSAVGVGAAGVLGAVLGGAIQYATKTEIDKLTAHMASTPGTSTISPAVPRSAVGLSAQATPAELKGSTAAFVDPGSAAPGLGIPSLISHLGLENVPGFKQTHDLLAMNWLGPITRGLASKSAVRRAVIAQFSGAGIRTGTALEGAAVRSEGTIEALVKQHFNLFAQVNHQQKKLYLDWFTATGKGPKLKSWLPTGSYNEFLEAVGDTMFKRINGVDTSDLPPALVQAADANLALFKEELKTAREAGIDSWAQLNDEQLMLRIATQRVRRDLVSAQYNDVEAILIAHAKQVLAGRVKDEQFLNGVAGVFGKRGKKVELNEAELDDFAETIAEQLLPYLLGEHGRHGAVDILHKFGESAAPFIYIDPTKVWANGKQWGNFLEKDAEKLSRSFIRSMAGDIELQRKFGVPVPAEYKGVDVVVNESKFRPFWSEFKTEQHARRVAADAITDPKKKERELLAIAQEAQDFQRDLAALVGRVRHTWGMPVDPASFGSRIGRGVSQLNTTRLMGGVILASIADPARVIMKAGVMNTFKHGFMPMFRGLSRMKMTAKEVRSAGTALDLYSHGRSSMMFDLFDELEHGTKVEKLLHFGTSKIGIAGLFDYWNTYMKQFSGSVWIGTLMDAIEARAGGTASQWQKEMLAELSIDEYTAGAMWAKVTKGGGGQEVHPGVWMPNTDDWSGVSDEFIAERLVAEVARQEKISGKALTKGQKKKLEYEIFSREHKESRSLQRTFRAALATLVDDTIVTPGLERPLWVDGSTAGRLIAQFRSFTLSSTMKVAMALGQDVRAGRVAPAVLGTMFSIALGSLSYYTWATAVGGRTAERMRDEFDKAGRGDWEGLSRIADESIARSGMLGVFSEVQKFAERVPATAPYATLSGKPSTRSPYVNPVLDLFGPTANIVKNLGTIALTFDDPTEATFRAGRQLMPYQNLFYLRRGLDDINAALAEAAGVDQ